MPYVRRFLPLTIVGSRWATSRRLMLRAAQSGLLMFVAAFAGCRTADDRVRLPARHSLQQEQLLVLSDVKLPADHPLIENLTLLRDEVGETLDLPVQTQQVVVYLFSGELRYQQYLRAVYPQLPPRRAYFVGTERELAVYTYWGERIQEDLRHEYTHGILHASLRDVPLWLDEGLAEYFELTGPPGTINREYAEHLLIALGNGWRPDLRRLEALESVGQMQRADYQEAWAWVHFMLHNSPEGREVLLEFLQELRETPHPGQLSARLQAAVPGLDERFVNYLATLPTTGRFLSASN